MGGGTACKEQPQLGQNSKPAFGPERWARSQCPRAEQSGLMHCTVQPGRYCMRVSPVAASPCEGFPQRQSELRWPGLCSEAALVSREKGYKI